MQRKETMAGTPAFEVPRATAEWQCSIFSSTFLKRLPASPFLECPGILSNSFGFPSPPRVAAKTLSRKEKFISQNRSRAILLARGPSILVCPDMAQLTWEALA